MSLLKQCRVVITIHNNKFFYDADGTRFGLAIVKIAYKMMVNHCAAVVTCSDEVKNSFVSDLRISPANARRIHVVNNGVPVPPPHPRKKPGPGPASPAVSRRMKSGSSPPDGSPKRKISPACCPPSPCSRKEG